MSEKISCMHLKLQGNSAQNGLGEEDIASDLTQAAIKCGAIKNSLGAPQ